MAKNVDTLFALSFYHYLCRLHGFLHLSSKDAKTSGQHVRQQYLWKKTRKQRSRSSVSDKNQIKTGAVKRDGSLSNKRSVVKEGTDIRRSGPERKSLLAAMVPYIRKSIVPIRKLFTANSKAPSTHELCSVCFAPAQFNMAPSWFVFHAKNSFIGMHSNMRRYIRSIRFSS